jgi:hypothetical protein
MLAHVYLSLVHPHPIRFTISALWNTFAAYMSS